MSQNNEILFDHRWKGSHGIGRFAAEIEVRIPELRPLPLSGSPTSSIDSFRLSKTLRVLRPGLFFTPGYNCPLFSVCPIVVTIHDLAHIQRGDAGILKRIYYRLVMQPALKRAVAVLVVSEYFRAEIAEWAGIESSKIFNVGNGVSSFFTEEGAIAKFDSPYLLHVGNQRPHKNLSRCLDAFAQAGLQSTHRLICTGFPTGTLSEKIHRLGLDSRVEFVGKVSDERLAELYRGATALVFVSLYEGFGIPIVEAMACGTPVITSDVTSMPEIAGDAALLVSPTDIGQIKDAMILVCENAQLRRDLAVRGLDRAALFTWERTASRVRAVIEAAADGRLLTELPI